MHEKPDVVIDQIKNIRYYVPNAKIVLHLHVNFAWCGSNVNFNSFDNVIVNPVSVPTFWGNLHHAHHVNFHFAKSQFEFTHFLLHSSSDLFTRIGVEDFISSEDAGVSMVPPQPTWGAPHFAEGDPVFQGIMRDAGAQELWCSQVEGTFYRKDLFEEMVAIIERHFDYRSTLPYVHEEIYYPTIINGLGVKHGDPYLLREDKKGLPMFRPELIDQIHAGQIEDYHVSRWKLGRLVETKVWSGKNIYALRPVPRDVSHPIRQRVRELMQVA